jgi:hypothetical protein
MCLCLSARERQAKCRLANTLELRLNCNPMSKGTFVDLTVRDSLMTGWKNGTSTHPKYCMFCATQTHSQAQFVREKKSTRDMIRCSFIFISMLISEPLSLYIFLPLFIHFHISFYNTFTWSSIVQHFTQQTKTEKQKEHTELRCIKQPLSDGDGVLVRHSRAVRRMSGLSVSPSLWLAPGSFSTSQVNIHLVQNKQVVWYRTWFTSHGN